MKDFKPREATAIQDLKSVPVPRPIKEVVAKPTWGRLFPTKIKTTLGHSQTVSTFASIMREKLPGSEHLNLDCRTKNIN